MEAHYPPLHIQFIGEERSRRYAYFGETTIAAAHICESFKSTSDAAKGEEPVKGKEMHQFNQTVRMLLRSSPDELSKGVWFMGG